MNLEILDRYIDTKKDEVQPCILSAMAMMTEMILIQI